MTGAEVDQYLQNFRREELYSTGSDLILALQSESFVSLYKTREPYLLLTLEL